MNATPNAVVATLSTPAQAAPTIRAATPKAAPVLRYVLMNRPGSGNHSGFLAAHTRAFMEVSGLLNGRIVPRETILRAWGKSALDYHSGAGMRTECKFEFSDKGYKLSEFGRVAFGKEIRSAVDLEKVAIFRDLMTSGKTDRACPESFKATKPV